MIFLNFSFLFQDELLQELEELEQEELERELLNVGAPVTDQLPSVPSAEPDMASSSRMWTNCYLNRFTLYSVDFIFG